MGMIIMNNVCCWVILSVSCKMDLRDDDGGMSHKTH